MPAFLLIAGVFLIFASVIIASLSNSYGVLIFTVIFALGSVVLGLGKIIELLQEINKK